MKKSVILCVLLFLASTAMAKGPQGVANGIHNLSSSATDPFYRSGNEDEICIFCHTPHGGALTAPLWNRVNPAAGGFTHYTSASLSTTFQTNYASNRNVNDESLACLSCHDGSVALNSLLNYSNDTGAAPDQNYAIPNMGFIGMVGSKIGDAPDGLGGVLDTTGNLTDDHPISFSYHQVSNAVENTAKLRTVLEAETSGVRFFPIGVAAANTTKRVECSTCHDPHVDYVADPDYNKFLIMSNSGSALCLACHKK